MPITNRYKDQNTGHGNQTGWLTTFNDMITLLMVFFVLLFSMGTLDFQRFKHFQNALQSALGILNEGRIAPVGLISPDQVPDLNREQIQDSNAKATDSQDIEILSQAEGLEADYTPRGLQLTLDDKLLFSSASANLTASGSGLLKKISATIRPTNRIIVVEGHTDNVPIYTKRYPSNWELSAARAINVVKFFITQGGIDPKRLAAAGYGDSKPRVSNDSAGNRSKNRRVEIILSHTPAGPAGGFSYDP
ncbi:MAG: flagellar motor protein MotB [Desulfobacteraceae bacterium]|nr:flagellar motor protein MotB [Desulfobacteraceae bacterium]